MGEHETRIPRRPESTGEVYANCCRPSKIDCLLWSHTGNGLNITLETELDYLRRATRYLEE
jgi:hypothetical protein